MKNRPLRWNILFLTIAVIAFVPLTITVFGDQNPAVMTVCAIVIGIALVGSCAFAVLRLARPYQQSNPENATPDNEDADAHHTK